MQKHGLGHRIRTGVSSTVTFNLMYELAQLRQPVVDFLTDAIGYGYHIEIQSSQFIDVDRAMKRIDKLIQSEGMVEVQVFNKHRHVATLVSTGEPTNTVL